MVGLAGCRSGGVSPAAGPSEASVRVRDPGEEGPAAVVSTFGGDGADFVRAVAATSGGALLVAGWVDGAADFGSGEAGERLTAGRDGQRTLYVLEIDPRGRPRWVRSFEGRDGGGFGGDVAVAGGADGSIVVAGAFDGKVDFGPGPGESERTAAGATDAFVLKLEGSGVPLWVATIGGPGEDAAFGATVTSTGDVVLTGWAAEGADLDPARAVRDFSAGSDGGPRQSAFVLALGSDGAYSWSRVFESTDDARGTDVAAAPDGGVVVVGSFLGTMDVDPGSGREEHVSRTWEDAFVVRFDRAGGLEWGLAFSGGSSQYANGVAVDEDGAVVVVGSFQGDMDFDPGPGEEIRESSLSEGDGFVVRLDGAGRFRWVRTFAPPSATVSFEDVALGRDGTAIAVGSFYDTVDLDPGPGLDERTASLGDGLAVAIAADGAYRGGATSGGDGYQDFTGIAVLPSGMVLVAGEFEGDPPFATEVGAASPRRADGLADCFVAVVPALASGRGADAATTSPSATEDP